MKDHWHDSLSYDALRCLCVLTHEVITESVRPLCLGEQLKRISSLQSRDLELDQMEIFKNCLVDFINNEAGIAEVLPLQM